MGSNRGPDTPFNDLFDLAIAIVATALVGLVLTTFLNSGAGIAGMVVTLSVLLTLRYRASWTKIGKAVCVGAGLVIAAGVVIGPTIKTRIVGSQPTPTPAPTKTPFVSNGLIGIELDKGGIGAGTLRIMNLTHNPIYTVAYVCVALPDEFKGQWPFYKYDSMPTPAYELAAQLGAETEAKETAVNCSILMAPLREATHTIYMIVAWRWDVNTPLAVQDVLFHLPYKRGIHGNPGYSSSLPSFGPKYCCRDVMLCALRKGAPPFAQPEAMPTEP
jgi:hypothetical protein